MRNGHLLRVLVVELADGLSDAVHTAVLALQERVEQTVHPLARVRSDRRTAMTRGPGGVSATL